ncbi:MAG: CBS domain-containing protein [Deltaproteobacteria bacterium]|nr:CBS domain-containing protein [Deltaproteobacteria bacterium]MBW2218175.1 CBS domain-containing protein [Deltaproteobacteria bacterium]
MFFEKKVKDLMIPINDYAVTSPEKTLKNAVLDMRKIYCEIEAGTCTEAGHRTSLVLDSNGKLVGILDFQSILKVLIPEIAGKLSDKLAALSVSVAFAEANASDLDEARAGFKKRVLKNTETKVADIMLKIKGKIDSAASLLDALKLMHKNKITVIPVFENHKVVGVLRDSDLFLATASILSE